MLKCLFQSRMSGAAKRHCIMDSSILEGSDTEETSAISNKKSRILSNNELVCVNLRKCNYFTCQRRRMGTPSDNAVLYRTTPSRPLYMRHLSRSVLYGSTPLGASQTCLVIKQVKYLQDQYTAIGSTVNKISSMKGHNSMIQNVWEFLDHLGPTVRTALR